MRVAKQLAKKTHIKKSWNGSHQNASKKKQTAIKILERKSSKRKQKKTREKILEWKQQKPNQKKTCEKILG